MSNPNQPERRLEPAEDLNTVAGTMYAHGALFDVLLDFTDTTTGVLDYYHGGIIIDAEHERLLDMGYPQEHLKVIFAQAIQNVAKARDKSERITADDFVPAAKGLAQQRLYAALYRDYSRQLEVVGEVDKDAASERAQRHIERYERYGISAREAQTISAIAHITAQRNHDTNQQEEGM